MENKKVRYKSVQEMTRALADDEAFTEDLEKRLAQRRIVKHLIALRCARGMSQKDVAEKLGCTQSRVSKLENGTDDELRLGDLLGYAEALFLGRGVVKVRH